MLVSFVKFTRVSGATGSPGIRLNNNGGPLQREQVNRISTQMQVGAQAYRPETEQRALVNWLKSWNSLATKEYERETWH